MSVYKCPVCEGRGTVPSNFYSCYSSGTAVNTAPVTCKSCGGRGVIFDSDACNPFTMQEPYSKYLNETITSCNSCSNCGNNDGMVYMSNPPKWKCTLDDEWHTGAYCCDCWCEHQQVYLQGKPVMGEWPCTTNCKLNSTGTEDIAIEGLTKSNTTD